MKTVIVLALFLGLLVQNIEAWGSNKDRVRLQDVNAITLTQGKMTSGRRSSPVPQLKCVGGTAGCHAFQPKVVQCMNRGYDGYDVQWECKTDMDSAYRFGQIQVSCEGYDYPDDPYVLRGSCGLEFELDLTEEGYKQRSQGGGHYRDDYYHHQPPRYDYNYGWSSGFSFRKLIGYVIAGCVIYWALKFCCSGPRTVHGTSSSTYSSSYSGAGTTSGSYGTGTGSGTGSGPGFWTGAATGGMLGYLFGNRGNGGWGYSGSSWGGSYGRRPYSGGWGSGWSSRGGGWSSGGGGWGSSGGGWSSGQRRSSGSSSRTTSGFGGTSRR